MTAEGDNSVLMQKVAKERLGELMKSKPILPTAPSSTDLSNRDFLLYLLETREFKQFLQLGVKMGKAGKAAAIMKRLGEVPSLAAFSHRAANQLP